MLRDCPVGGTRCPCLHHDHGSAVLAPNRHRHPAAHARHVRWLQHSLSHEELIHAPSIVAERDRVWFAAVARYCSTEQTHAIQRLVSQLMQDPTRATKMLGLQGLVR